MIIPTILTADLEKAKERLALLKGVVNRIQIDIVDGNFADNQTIMPAGLLGLEEKNSFLLDFHLMVEDPTAFLDCNNWPGQTNLITGQIETMPSQVEFVRKTKEEGLLAGLAVDSETELGKLDIRALDLVDQVLLLGVKAGLGGQKMNPKVLNKIKELVILRQKERWPFRIGVDGGVDQTSLVFCRKMGAEEFFIGSAIWEADNPVEKLEELRNLI